MPLPGCCCLTLLPLLGGSGNMRDETEPHLTPQAVKELHYVMITLSTYIPSNKETSLKCCRLLYPMKQKNHSPSHDVVSSAVVVVVDRDRCLGVVGRIQRSNSTSLLQSSFHSQPPIGAADKPHSTPPSSRETQAINVEGRPLVWSV